MENYTILAEKLRQAFLLLRSQLTRNRLDNRTPAEEIRTGFQLFTYILLDRGKIGMLRKNKLQARFASFYFYTILPPGYPASFYIVLLIPQ